MSARRPSQLSRTPRHSLAIDRDEPRLHEDDVVPPTPEVGTRFDPELRALWLYMRPQPLPCFTLQFLTQFGAHARRIHARHGVTTFGGRDHSIAYAVLASSVPGVFSFGGDLELFREAIIDRDRGTLLRYARLCVDSQWRWNHHFDAPLTTISLVQGHALGGGLEAALASSVIVAEESARMGLPEARVNLFPGIGAYSFLARKVGRRVAEMMVASGATYSARALYEMGVVDVLAADGTGEVTVERYIREHSRRAPDALDRMRAAIEPVPSVELYRIAEMWADAALEVKPRDLALMARVVRAQHRCAKRLGTS